MQFHLRLSERLAATKVGHAVLVFQKGEAEKCMDMFFLGDYYSSLAIDFSKENAPGWRRTETLVW